jgi:hypothetical protein|tara:strand:+ start:3032 stop:3181 length:150 start_codon:yes stop_codon:yes gene_type:complete
MTIKKEFQQAVKDIEKESLKKPASTAKPASLKKRMSRIVEGDDPGYHLR